MAVLELFQEELEGATNAPIAPLIEVAQTRLDEAISSRVRVAGQLVGLRAQVASAELDLERTRIVAPFSGRVLAVDVEFAGQLGCLLRRQDELRQQRNST